MANNSPIGVFDSGVGGLTVVKEMIKLMPNEDLIYFGDTARVPYGARPPEQIIEFMQEILDFFAVQKVKMAVVACNAMTSVGLNTVRKRYSFPIVGVNRGVERALKLSKSKRIGVIATVATVNSGLHEKTILERDPSAKVYSIGCPKLVPLIEKGILDGPELIVALTEYLAPLKQEGVDAIILACTHYPFVTTAISRIMGPETVIIDPAYETAQDAQDILTGLDQAAAEKQGAIELCFSAAIDHAKKMAGYLFDTRSVNFKIINLQDFCK